MSALGVIIGCFVMLKCVEIFDIKKRWAAKHAVLIWIITVICILVIILRGRPGGM